METFKPLATVRFDDDKAKPMEVMLSRDEKTLYVAGGRANEVVVVDTGSMQVTKKIPVGRRVWGLAINRDGSRVFSTDGASNAGADPIEAAQQAIVEAVRAGDPKRAAEWMARHSRDFRRGYEVAGIDLATEVGEGPAGAPAVS